MSTHGMKRCAGCRGLPGKCIATQEEAGRGPGFQFVGAPAGGALVTSRRSRWRAIKHPDTPEYCEPCFLISRQTGRGRAAPRSHGLPKPCGRELKRRFWRAGSVTCQLQPAQPSQTRIERDLRRDADTRWRLLGPFPKLLHPLRHVHAVLLPRHRQSCLCHASSPACYSPARRRWASIISAATWNPRTLELTGSSSSLITPRRAGKCAAM